jgi:hypothetical protein
VIVTWMVQVARMEGMQILVGITVGKGPCGRRNCEHKDNKVDCEEMDCGNFDWICISRA